MALIVIVQNRTENLERADGTADYEVEVSVNRARFIWVGEIKNHRRADGAKALLQKVVDQMKD